MYELLKSNKETIRKLSDCGVISPNWIRDIEIYEEFERLEMNCVMCKYTILSEQFGLSAEQIRKCIKRIKNL